MRTQLVVIDAFAFHLFKLWMDLEFGTQVFHKKLDMVIDFQQFFFPMHDSFGMH
jgi:hypothetical protein